MNPRMSADRICAPLLSTGELVGLSVTGLLIVTLVANAVFFDSGASFLAWHAPNVIFAVLAAGALFALLHRGHPVTFEHALGVTAAGIVVTSVVAVAQISWTFDLPTIGILASYVLPHYATYVLPVVLLFLLGAARTSRQRFVSGLLIAAVLLTLVLRISGPYAQFVQLTFYSANVVLGFPLAVLGRQYSS